MDAQEIGRRLVTAHTAYVARSGRQPFLRMAPHLRVDTDGKVHAWISVDQGAYLRGTCDTFEGALNKLDAAISAMPSEDERLRNEACAAIATAIERCRAANIEADFVNPLEVMMKRLSENALELAR